MSKRSAVLPGDGPNPSGRYLSVHEIPNSPSYCSGKSMNSRDARCTLVAGAGKDKLKGCYAQF